MPWDDPFASPGWDDPFKEDRPTPASTGWDDPFEDERKTLSLDNRTIIGKTGAAVGHGLSEGMAKFWDAVGAMTALPERAGVMSQKGDYPGLDYASRRAQTLRADAPDAPEGLGYGVLESLAEVPGQAAKYAIPAAIGTAVAAGGALPALATSAVAMGATDFLESVGKGESLSDAAATGVGSALTGAAMGGAAKLGLAKRALVGGGTMGGMTALQGGSPEDVLTAAATGGILGGITREEPKAPPGPRQPTASGLPSLEEHINLEARTPKPSPLWERFRHAAIDTLDTVDEVTDFFANATGKKRANLTSVTSDELSPGNDAYAVARVTQKRSGAITHESVVGENQRDFNGEIVGRGLLKILEPVRDNLDEFKRFMVTRHEADLNTRKGIVPNVDPDEAMKILVKGKKLGWDKIHDEVVKWGNNDKYRMVQAGHMAPEEYQAWVTENPYYAPRKREFERDQFGVGSGGQGMTDLGAPGKRASKTGSDKVITDPIANLILDSERVSSISGKAKVANLLAGYADQAPEKMAPWIEQVQPPKGLNPMEKSAWAEKSAKDNVVRIMRNGQEAYYKLNPKLYDTVKNMDKLSFDFFTNTAIGRGISLAKRGATLGATGVNVGFQLMTNPMRDLVTAIIQRPGWDVYKAPAGAFRTLLGNRVFKDPQMKAAREGYRGGGGFGSQSLGAGYEDAVLLQKKLLQDSKFRASIVHPIEFIKDKLSVFESANRVPEYMRAKELYGGKGFDAEVAGQLAAADVTTDFAKMGNIAQYVGQMVPFFTASISGLDTAVKAVAKRPVKTAAAAITALTAPKLYSWYMNKDDQWYQELPQWEKNLFVHFKLGDEIMRIPMPYGWGQVFGAIPEEIANGIYKNDPEGAGKNIVEAIGQALPVGLPMSGPNRLAEAASNITPSVVKPLAEVAFNVDMFRGTPLESQAMQQLLPQERYNESTPEIYKSIAKTFSMLGISPIQVQHLAEGYTGGAIRDITSAPRTAEGLRALAKVASPSFAAEGGLEPGAAANIPAVGRLFSRQDRTGQSVNDFYDQLTKDEQTYKTMMRLAREGRDAEVSKYLDKYAPVFSRIKMERKIAEQLRDLKKAKDSKTATELARLALGR